MIFSFSAAYLDIIDKQSLLIGPVEISIRRKLSMSVSPLPDHPQIIAMLNAYTAGASGADVMCCEILARWSRGNRHVITSAQGREFMIARGLDNASYWLSTKEKTIRWLIPTYFWRTVMAMFRHPSIETDCIIYASSDFFPDTLPALWYKLRYWRNKPRWVQRVHHLIPPQRKISHLAQRASLWLIQRYADAVICGDPSLLAYLEAHGFRADRLHHNEVGICRERIASAVVTTETPRYDAVYVGRLHPSKGILDLPHIWREVRAHWPNVRLGIIGSASNPHFENALQKEIAACALDHGNGIDLLGYKTEDELWPLVKAARVLLCPSHEEGFGITPIEGLAAGVPVVAYDLPVYHATVADALRLAPKFDYKAFAAQIIAAEIDVAGTDRRRRRAGELLTRYSWDQIAAREWNIATEIFKSREGGDTDEPG